MWDWGHPLPGTRAQAHTECNRNTTTTTEANWKYYCYVCDTKLGLSELFSAPLKGVLVAKGVHQAINTFRKQTKTNKQVTHSLPWTRAGITYKIVTFFGARLSVFTKYANVIIINLSIHLLLGPEIQSIYAYIFSDACPVHMKVIQHCGEWEWGTDQA